MMMNFRALRRYLMLVMFVSIILMAGCRGCDSSNHDYHVPGTPPVVESIVPLSGATDVALNTNVTAIFSKPMAATNASTTFSLKKAGTEVPSAVIYNELTGKLDPTADLDASTLYNVMISGARDTEGNALAADFTATFTTGLIADLIRPTVVSTDPADGAVGVPQNRVISVPFSEFMDPSTVTASTFRLYVTPGVAPARRSMIDASILLVPAGAVPVTGKVTCVGLTAVFTPDQFLTKGLTYSAVIDGGVDGVKDLAGNPMAEDYVWSFTAVEADLIRPTVTSTDPADNDIDVATNKKIAILFSEEMQPSTINTTTLTVKNPSGVTVPGLVTYVGVTANFTPTAPLTNGVKYTATITNAAADLAGNTMAANYVWSFTSGATADNTRPTVISADPVSGTLNVPTNQRVSITFSEGMDPASINATNLTLQKVVGTSKSPIAGTVTYGGVVANFAPKESLEFNTVYLFTATSYEISGVKTGVRDLAGNTMATSYLATFTTGSVADTTVPTVVSTEPANGATNVPTNSKIAVTFSESMTPGTLRASSFKVTGPGLTAVTGTVNYANLVANFTPTGNLLNNTVYTGTITSEATDLAGNALVEYSWTFTTGAAEDKTSPTVVSSDPAGNAQNVPLNKTLAVTFNESMNAATINATTFTLTKLGAPSSVAGAVDYSNLIAHFNPDLDLDSNATYTALITTGAKDLAGNALTGNYSWQFRTGEAKDTTAPTVISTDPVNNATGVSTNKIIAVTFSENMDATTIKTSSFMVIKPDTTAVAGTVNYSGVTAQFTPTGDLANNATYTVRVTSAVKDLAGNPLTAIYSFKFTTGAAPDKTAPTVFSTDPAADEKNVPFNKTVEVTFSEGMNSTTITTANFTLIKKDGGSPVAGVVTYSGLSAFFNPNADLAANATYTATVTTGVKDLAGNALAANKAWEFTTGAAPDDTAPTVLTRFPAINATNVATNTKVVVSFSEALKSSTINTTSFTLTKLGGSAVTGAVAYSGMIATFTPASSLAYNSTYTVTVTTQVEDLAGNNLAFNNTWNFSTGAAPDSIAPTVTFTDPGTNETGVAVNKTISITFSEGMDQASIDDTTVTVKKLGALANTAGAVTYSGLIAKLDPTANLDFTATYTVTIKSGATGVKDLAGNALAVDKVWSFQTGNAPDTSSPTVTLTDPLDGENDVALNQSIKATFSESVDPDTIDDQTFKVAKNTGGELALGTVTYDAITRTATFKPTGSLVASIIYKATIASSVKDLAGNSLDGNTLDEDHVWTFTTGLRTLAEPIALNAAAPYGAFGGSAGITNEGIKTVINGDIGTTAASTLITGFRDGGGNVYTVTGSNDGLVTGLIYTATAPPGSVPGEDAEAAHLAATNAFLDLSPARLPGGIDVSSYGGNPDQLGNRTLKPGIYKSAPGSFIIQGGALTLDAQGDANAVWVFQMASTLTVGGPGAAFPQSVILINGAQAKNVFWQVSSAATINAGGGGTMFGTIISEAGVTFSTSGNVDLVTLYGRALSLSASVTYVNTVVHIPAE
ncbi:MAG: hypothetical protein CVV41_20575 [Candidatus Riflebacteria bacterium HGW-Riflebacteria-1]|nr:MAG: hypothetical protein CVV41_20575 [Candidatus Riflebacteria bacterium HGW-Riflebacteria-1]